MLYRNMMFRGKRVRDGEMVEGYFFAWYRRGKEIPMIGEGVQNGSVNADEVDPETVEPLFVTAAQQSVNADGAYWCPKCGNFLGEGGWCPQHGLPASPRR